MSSQQIAQIVPFVFIFIIFYFVLIRPGTTRQKKLQQMIDNLKVGDHIKFNVTSEFSGQPSHCTDVWIIENPGGRFTSKR